MGRTLMVSDDGMILSSLRTKRDRFAAQLDVVEGVLHGWQNHMRSRDFEALKVVGLLTIGVEAGRPNYDTVERTQLRLMNRINRIDELMGQDHGLGSADYDREAQALIQEDVTIRAIDIHESSLTPDP